MPDIEKFGIDQKCIVRTYSAGVHFGTVVDRAGTEILLTEAIEIIPCAAAGEKWLTERVAHEA